MARNQHISYNTVDVFAAACAAQRINGRYLKQDDVTFHDDGHEYSHTVNRVANKTLTHQFLKGDFDIIESDRELGEKVMQFCRGLTFKLLTDKRLNEFEQNMLTIVEKETLDSYHIAIVSSLPSAYNRAEVRKVADVRIRETEGVFGAVGERVQVAAEVVKSYFSNQWGTYFITAITDDNKQVFFAYRQSLTVGDNINIEGKVKAHRDNATQLNYVKIV